MSSIKMIKYDVFISFRGEDVRHTFLSHLFRALCLNQIVTFMDENLDRGHEISPALLRVIEESHVALVIFSENYANSSWCLDELVKIVDCKKNMGQVVVPIFYRVDPTHVQDLTGSFGDEFNGLLEKQFNSKAESWRNALKETAEISGFDSRNLKDDATLVEDIVSLVHEKVNLAFPYVSVDDGLIGIDSRVNAIQSKLCIGSEDVRFLGIWGMGGIGKTTLAGQIYHQISSQFESACFVPNVRERLEKHTLHDLEREILSELLGKEISNSRRPHCFAKSSFICKWMERKKVLIVLDDVSDPRQIEFFIKRHDMYGLGSRVIMTSRDEQILLNCWADEICEVNELNNHEALQLLSLHAFRQNSPPEEYTKLAKEVVAYAKGLPLALKLLGSTLHRKSIGEWEDQLEKLEAVLDKKIENILRLSYDELDRNEKEIFLDIACFFKGDDRDNTESTLQSCGFKARIGIRILLSKALITISKNKLNMHDLLQQMGRDIARVKCNEEPRNCCRLWVPQDICNVLTKDMGEIFLKSISLDVSKARDINLSSSAFRRMKRLQLLKIYNPYYLEKEYTSYNGVFKIQQPKCFFWRQCSTGIIFLPEELRYLYWYGYPSKSLPLKYCSKNLVQLHLIHSHVEQLCIKNQCFESLKLMDLSYSVKITRISDLSKFPKLEVLHLRGCTSLVKIRSTRPYDSELRHLDLESCRSLCYFSSFLYMGRLDFLSLEGCSKIAEFPVIPRSMRFLILSKTAVNQVPSTIDRCSQLTKLELKSCTSFQSLPSNIGELQLLELLNLMGCSKLTSLPDSTCNLKSLKSLFVNECQNLKELPENIGNLKCLEKLDATRSGIRILPPTINGLVKLESLDCSGCRDLILPPFTGLPSLKWLSLDDCGLSEISDTLGSLKSLSGLYLDENNLKKLPMTIKQLSRLKLLHLRGNKRLEYIPELPPTLRGLSVHNCTSLETILSFKYVNVDFFQFLDARNCINFEASCCRKILDAVLLGIENTLPQLRHSRRDDEGFCKEMLMRSVLLAALRFAGDELPPRMKHNNENGSTIFISMGQCDPHDFMVIIFSAVLTSTDNEAGTAIKFQGSVIKCECCFVTETGFSINQSCYNELFMRDKYSEEYAPGLENNWVWAYRFQLKDKQRLTQASFQFFVKIHESDETENSDLRVKRCGVICLPF